MFDRKSQVMSENVSTLYIYIYTHTYIHTYIHTYAFLIVHTYTAMVPPQSPGLGHAFAPLMVPGVGRVSSGRMTWLKLIFSAESKSGELKVLEFRSAFRQFDNARTWLKKDSGRNTLANLWEAELVHLETTLPSNP